MEQRRKLIPVISEAISKTFDKGDWKSIGYATENEYFIQNHPRLLRSLQWGDEDYEGCVFDVVEHIYDSGDKNIEKLLGNSKVEIWIKSNKPDIYKEYFDNTYVPSFKQRNLSPSEIVDKALEDAQTLIISNGPVSAIDRVHTALHGYLKHQLDQKNIDYRADAGITELYKCIRENVREIRELGERSEDMNKMLRSLTSILDALNPIRNRASVAHANDILIGEAEAKFVINIVSSVLHYLDEKLK
ncbi:abortive infection family protein [Dickeya zeae]|uniref:abortive infection family protein n=1 Tax=Dickeya zeae TaxID=204042 RepID=UPI001CFA2713|nr:abortive infection family protein [Dickeya zeae]UCZ77147.1 abortive infection family protein [Dickeya zeae]